MSIYISVQAEHFDVGDELKQLTLNGTVGAISSFIGCVRNNQQASPLPIKKLHIEHYPLMTEKTLQSIVQCAHVNWPIDQTRLIHRFGQLEVGENIVMVICTAAKRIAAMQATESIVHQLKINAPFWKKEIFTNGSSQWVEQDQRDIELSQ